MTFKALTTSLNIESATFKLRLMPIILLQPRYMLRSSLMLKSEVSAGAKKRNLNVKALGKVFPKSCPKDCH